MSFLLVKLTDFSHQQFSTKGCLGKLNLKYVSNARVPKGRCSGWWQGVVWVGRPSQSGAGGGGGVGDGDVGGGAVVVVAELSTYLAQLIAGCYSRCYCWRPLFAFFSFFCCCFV